MLPLNAIVSQRACNSPSFHVLYLGPKIVKNLFCYFWLDVQIHRGHPLTLISALGVTILPLNGIVSQCACNSPSFHVLYLGPKIVKNMFCYFGWMSKYIGDTL